MKYLNPTINLFKMNKDHTENANLEFGFKEQYLYLQDICKDKKFKPLMGELDKSDKHCLNEIKIVVSTNPVHFDIFLLYLYKVTINKIDYQILFDLIGESKKIGEIKKSEITQHLNLLIENNKILLKKEFTDYIDKMTDFRNRVAHEKNDFYDKMMSELKFDSIGYEGISRHLLERAINFLKVQIKLVHKDGFVNNKPISICTKVLTGLRGRCER